MKTKATKATKTEASAKANGATGTKVTSRPDPLHNLLDLDDLDNDDDIFSADFKKSGKVQRDDYEEDTEGEDEPVAPRKQARGKGRQAKLTEDVDMKDFDPDDDFVVPDDDAAELKRLGVAAVFQPGASLDTIVSFIREAVALG